MYTTAAAERLRVVADHLAPQPEARKTTGAMSGAPLTSHVLDTANGRPARGLLITFFRKRQDDWVCIKSSETNADGRCSGFLRRDDFTADIYKMRFDTADYFHRMGQRSFYPYVEIVFEVLQPEQHYHVPLILSRFGYSTYRGS
ncbi:5-hydroxyisourate hydrolase-like [Pollicipes pollicipes]|uniref:5-hydroxyisourate hydrolase-like n=1 Tax=Pollicipes pollicipes TaxID=41117 RepID=UPI001884C037|nr:5-hydroxyisourate hydrolase-like [Pollicipes pollicipes]